MKKNVFFITLLLTSSLTWAESVTVGVSGTARDGSDVSASGVGSNPAEALNDANENLGRAALDNGGVESVTPEDTNIITDTRNPDR